MYRFDAFQVDPRTHELRRGGVRIKIQEQSFVVLLKLLEHPGELVTREQLRNALWPADTFVDFDTGLNTVIKRLREVLRDSAEGPHFIETVPKLGYRFIAPVQVVGEPAAGGHSAQEIRAHPRLDEMGGGRDRPAGCVRDDCFLLLQGGAAKRDHGRSRAPHGQV